MTETRNHIPSSEAKSAVLNEQLEDLYRATPLAMVQIDLDYNIRKRNCWPKPHDNLSVADISAYCAEDIRERPDSTCHQYFDRVLSSGQPCQLLHSFTPEDGHEPRTFNTLWYPVFDDEGKISAVGAITQDITEVEQRERTLKHIARELQHRVKNTLANVLALVEQAERSAAKRHDALAILKRRIMALSATHSRLTESNWGPTSLRDILDQEMTRVYGPDAVKLDGPDLLMTAQSALAFSMGLHEMTANAASYGSLSRTGGFITLRWTIDPMGEDGGWVHFSWKEEGGPEVEEPSSNGFGHRLIDASLRTSLRGKMERIWEGDGLRYRFSLPLPLVSGS